MSKGKALGGSVNSLKTASPSKTSAESPKSTFESSVPAVDNLCKPTRAKLYGYDFAKNRLRDTLNKSRTFRVSQAVSILNKATGENIMPVCRAFLKKFDYKDKDLREPIRKRIFFAGGDENEHIKPQEMKYAVFRLLGLSDSVAFNQIGMHDENSRDRISLALAPDFSRKVEEVQLERSLYPLKHTEEFPELTQALDGITTSPHYIRVEEIFKQDRVPPMVAWAQKKGNQYELPLDAVLSILKLGLEGRTYGDISARKHGLSTLKVSEKEVEILLSVPELSPFSGKVLALLEKKRDEKKAQRVQPERNLG